MSASSEKELAKEKVGLLMNEIVELMAKSKLDGGAIFLVESDFGLVTYASEFNVSNKETVSLSLMATLSRMYGLDYLDELSANLSGIKKIISDSESQLKASGVLH